MIPTFNCNRFLPTTLEGVLDQDPGPANMQIEVVDDHSAEDPAALVATIGKGRVSYFRQRRNVGIHANFSTCLNAARGRLVHLLHGDDRVLAGFYARMERLFESSPDLGAAFCRHLFIDAEGRELGTSGLERETAGPLADALERLALEQRIMTPSVVVRREVYEKLGGFDDRLACAEDWEMWVRIAAHYPVGYEPAVLAAYRMHDASNTGRNTRNAANMRYTRMAIAIFEGYLPRDRARDITRRARGTYAASATDLVRQRLRQRDWPGALAQAHESLRFRFSARTVARLLKAFIGR